MNNAVFCVIEEMGRTFLTKVRRYVTRRKRILLLFILIAVIIVLQAWKSGIISHTTDQEDFFNHRKIQYRKRTHDNFLYRKTPNRVFEVDKNCETVQIAIVCAGYDASREVVTLIKSILFYRRYPLHIHLIVDVAAKRTLSTLFRTWGLPDFTVSFYLSGTLEKKVSWIPSFHYSGVYGLLKLVISDALPPEIENVVILDIDIVVLCDIGELWKFFLNFSHKNSIGLVENQSDWYLGKISRHKPWPAVGKGYNTGVMLVNCTKLRELKWENIWTTVAKQELKILNGTILADQDIINAVIKDHQSIVFTLPCEWNVQLSKDTDSLLCFHGDASSIRLLHWNAHGGLKSKNVPAYLFDYFRNFAIHDGAILQSPVGRCHSQIDSYERENLEAEDNFCRKMLNDVLKLRRIHLYYLHFIYTSGNTRDVTLVTQLSMDRISMLDLIAKQWQGPISVAIYLSDPEALKLLQYVKNSLDLKYRTNIGYHLVFENIKDLSYPINLLRNVALQQANTEFLFLCDIDFAPSKNLYEYLTDSVLSGNLKDSKIAYVIPAFESFRYQKDFPGTKSELLEQWDRGVITPFRSYVWLEGHNATDYAKWRTSRNSYIINWEMNFEPYVVVSKHLCPLYDKRFFGFGWNKVSHIMQLDALGFQFNVLPFGFVVHMPHAPSADISKFRTSSEYRDCTHQLKNEFIKDLAEKYNIDPKRYFGTVVT